MLADKSGSQRHLKVQPSSELARAAANVLRMSIRGLLLGRPHRLLDPMVKIGSTEFGVASAMFFSASALRHSALGGTPVETVLLASAVYYCVLMLISLGGRIGEFMLCLSVSVGTDLFVSGLALAGIVSPNSGAAQGWIFGWELTAMFIAMCRLRSSRLAVLAA